MITKEETYKIAFQRKEKRANKRNLEREILLKSAYSEHPELTEIDNKLMSIGSELVVTALSGDSEKLEKFKESSELLALQKSAILKKCNVPETAYECGICSDTGYVSGAVCECIKREAASVMSEFLSKEMPLKDSKFENFDLNYYEGDAKRRMTSILKLCKEYVINFSPESSPNLLFIGRTGLGKTHLTLAIVSGIIEKGFLPIYGSAENLFSAVESEKFGGEGKGVYESMLGCDLLVIDDLGAEMVTSFTRSVLYNLINTRILSGRPTIVNTNLSMKEIEERYSERISSRFIGNYDWREFLGKDIRQQKILNK